MKVIDLLNKIANKEEIPLIELYGRTLKYNKDEHWFDDVDDVGYCRYNFTLEELNDEVIVIKKIESIDPIDYCHSTDSTKDMVLVEKINEIIDKINEME